MILIDYFNQFWKEFRNKGFSPNDTLLYFYLLNVWNLSGRKEQFECNTKEIEIFLGMNKVTLTRCREKLQKRGLIEYNKGNRKVKNPSYFLCHVTNSVTNDVTNSVTNDVTNSVTNPKEKVSPTPPLKENNLESREKERITKVIPKKEEDLAFCLPSYVPIMQTWLDYKRERGQAYKPRGIRACYNNLMKLSGNNPTIAQMIVDQSIANNYQGLFELKSNGVNKANHTSKHEANKYAIEQFLRDREARENGMACEVEKPF